MPGSEQTVAEIELLYQQRMTVRIPCNHVPPSPEDAYRLVKDAGPQTVVDALPASWMDVTTSGNLNVVDIQEDDGLRADGSGGTKRMRVPSVLVDCRDCDAVIEVDARTFDLAVERGPGTFLCDDCRDERNCAVDTEADRDD